MSEDVVYYCHECGKMLDADYIDIGTCGYCLDNAIDDSGDDFIDFDELTFNASEDDWDTVPEDYY